MSLSPEQIAMRREGITATDTAALVNAHPFRRPIDVWLEKVGQSPVFVESTRSKWGTILEAPIRADYAERRNYRVEVPGTLVHPDAAWRMATPDGVSYVGSHVMSGLEIKVHGRDVLQWSTASYGDPLTDEVLPWELCQCEWNIDVAQIPRWELVAFVDNEPTDYVIDRDDELIGMLVEAGERFMVDHVKPRIPPPPDGSARYAEFLADRWKTNNETLLDVSADPVLLTTLEALRLARIRNFESEEEIEALTQKLKVAIGDHAGLSWPNLKKPAKPHAVTWKRNKARRVTDWIGVMADMRQAAALVASAKATQIDRAILSLRSMGSTTTVGHSSQATITAGEMLEVIIACRDTLLDIQRASTEAARTKIVDGNRPFNCPGPSRKDWTVPVPQLQGATAP